MKKQSVWSKVGAIALTVLGGFYGLLGLVSYFIRTWDFGIDTFFLLTGLLIGYYGVKAIKEAFAQGDGRVEPLRPVPAAAPKVKVKREEASPSPVQLEKVADSIQNPRLQGEFLLVDRLLERDGLYQVSPYRGCLPTLEKLGQDYARLEQKGQASPEAEKAVDDILNTWIRSIRNEDTGKQDALSQDIVFTAKALEQKMVMAGEGESPFRVPHNPS